MHKIFNPAALLAFALVVMLSGCADEPPVPVKPVFQTTPRYNLNVLTATIVDRSTPVITDSPYDTNSFQPTIKNALQQMLAQKFVAVGISGDATIVIKDASLHQESIPHENDMFERKQASKYIARAEVEIDLQGKAGLGEVSAQATRYVTLPENPTALERQNAYYTVLNGLLHDLNLNLSPAVESHIGQFLVSGPVLNGPAR